MKKILIIIFGLSVFIANCKKDKDDKSVLFGAAILASQQQVATALPDATHKVTAKIREKASGSLLQNVTITFSQQTTKQLRATSVSTKVTTDANGQFDFYMAGYVITLKVKKADGTDYLGEAIVTPSADGGFPKVTYADGTEFVIEMTDFKLIDTSTNATYTIGGSITGLTVAGLVLQNNTTDDLTVAANATTFTFATKVTGAYSVTVKTQPTGYTCTVSSGSGTATANVTGVAVSCTANTYTIGGSVTGLTASGLVLQNNTADDLTVAANATSFSFATKVTGTYSVTVKTQPTGYTCTVSSGSGTATADVNSVSISCSVNTYTIGGSISGLTASGLVLQNNNADDLTISANATTFSFSTKVTGSYSVTVKTQPTGLACTVINGSGTASTNISNVSIICYVTVIRNWGTFTDMRDGTVKLDITAGTFGGIAYTTKTLYFTKCTNGQMYNPTTNDCTGTGTGDLLDNYGAAAGMVKYCSNQDGSCNDGGTSLLNGIGLSGAWTACKGLNSGSGTYRKTTWRVPTKEELKLLINCKNATEMPNDSGSCSAAGYPSIIPNIFPNTVPSFYWSSTSKSLAEAWYVGFNGGFVNGNTKDMNLYLRCVSEGQ